MLTINSVIVLVNFSYLSYSRSTMSQNRQLAAIMFTDIVGYTALMGKDEQKAFDILKKNRQIQRPLIDHHNGKFLKEMGDGMLASFHTVSDAVYCALEIQNRCKQNAGFQLRIGIHLGEVVFEKNDVFGDGVNIASRIQSVAQEGETVVSESVYRNIANKKGLQAEFISEESLKNVDSPIKIYRVKLDSNIDLIPDRILHQPTHSTKPGFTIRKKSAVIILCAAVLAIAAIIFSSKKAIKTITAATPTAQGASDEKKSIVVLPFKDLSPNKDQEYLSDGIAEEIRSVLNSLIKDLKVTGRTSSNYFKDSASKIIGERLNVKSILEGSFQKLGNRVKVIVKLINAHDESIIWSYPYDKELKDIFKIQNEIATTVGEKLQLTFSENYVNDESRTVNPEAFEMNLKGNLNFNKGGYEGFQAAVEFHKKAIKIDPAYAYPYIRLGWAQYRLTLSGVYPAKIGFNMARTEVLKGLSLDASPSEKQSAHTLLAYINLWEYNWKEARDEYEKSLAINPKQSGFKAFYQSLGPGKSVEGIAILEKIVAENPVDLSNLNDLAILQYLGRQFAAAKKTCEKIIALEPGFSEAYRIKGMVFSAEKKLDSAMINYIKARELNNLFAPILSIITLPSVGKKQDAVKLFSVIDTMRSVYIPPAAKALILYSLGDANKGFEWLNRSYNERDFLLAFLKVDPLWDPLRSDPRFQNIMQKMNFPPE